VILIFTNGEIILVIISHLRLYHRSYLYVLGFHESCFFFKIEGG
jgi:hypothetical protein